MMSYYIQCKCCTFSLPLFYFKTRWQSNQLVRSGFMHILANATNYVYCQLSECLEHPLTTNWFLDCCKLADMMHELLNSYWRLPNYIPMLATANTTQFSQNTIAILIDVDTILEKYLLNCCSTSHSCTFQLDMFSTKLVFAFPKNEVAFAIK